ncbi:polysaccharide biosynthesis tyrosine autokinase [Actinotalea ferrariae]|uniref:polysaccharide biosynthesis tyrosine autokinase n=1 Tax=Actinotalea ferrariae TaxID=1386098 RepID=UPI001C8B9F21|nr:polysaccharide biosynthesis tyrosine autokinase [Actinotalea ferrariae]MBX9244236.1 polysaccharide biosynthesis tyrosine autokinase [Actinotalea ferrariae]
MELQDYVAILRKRWVSISLITLVALGAAVGVTLLTTPTYEARAQVFVSVRTGGGTTSDLLQGSSFTQKQVKSYTDLVTSPRVLIPVIENLDLSTTPDELARSIAADNPLDTVLINITATHEDPQHAADIANSTAESLATEVTVLEKPQDGPSPVQISSVRAAAPPVDPASPNTKLNVALGVLVGLALGFGIALLREVLDTRVRTEADVRKVTGTSVVAQIVHDDDATRSPLLLAANPHSQRSESFRRLRTNLQFLDVTDDLQTMVVTSSLPGEGKSTTAINLAITLADAGTRVLLIDADLRRPSVARYMDLEGTVGLTTVLIGRASVQDVVQPWGNGQLHVLPSGQIPPNPSELLGSRTMAELLATVSSRYDVVIIDTPPLLPVTDAAILARLTGGAIVVVGAHSVHQQELGQSLGALETVGARVLGLVLNRVPAKQAGSYAYYDYSPLEPTSEARKSRRMSALTARRAQEVEPRRTAGRSPSRDAARHDVVPEHPEEALAAAVGGNRWPGGPLGADQD